MGQCGTGDHSRAPANRKRNRDESCVDVESVAGRKSTKAFKGGDAARACRGEAKENMPKRRYAQVRRIISKGQNKVCKVSMSATQVQTKSQHASGQGINRKNRSRSVRKMKSISFHVFNMKGKGKGKGKQGQGKTNGKGKGKGNGRL